VVTPPSEKTGIDKIVLVELSNANGWGKRKTHTHNTKETKVK